MHNSGNVRLNLINLKTRKITKITYSDILAEYLRDPLREMQAKVYTIFQTDFSMEVQLKKCIE